MYRSNKTGIMTLYGLEVQTVFKACKVRVILDKT